jgi:hypothetical protein
MSYKRIDKEEDFTRSMLIVLLFLEAIIRRLEAAAFVLTPAAKAPVAVSCPDMCVYFFALSAHTAQCLCT